MLRVYFPLFVALMPLLATTLDGVLNRRVTLEQPVVGFRIAVDTVFLAAAVPALTGDRVLDMGCGVGGAMLCLAYRISGITGLGIDSQSDLVEICQRNIVRNVFASGLGVRKGDVTRLLPEEHTSFDHALMNPPYHEEERHDVSPDVIKRTANSEKTGDLALWIHSAALALKPSGVLTLIHRADRKDEIISYLQPVFGEIEILPLASKQGAEAKRVIIRARKDAIFSTRLRPALVLHKLEGGYTDEAEGVLRYCLPI